MVNKQNFEFDKTNRNLELLPSYIEIISNPESIKFPISWYEIMDENHFWMVWRTRVFLQQCFSLSIPTEFPCSVLEVGCGHGILRQMLEKSTQWNIDAVDLNIHALRHCPPGRGRTALYNIHDRSGEFTKNYDIIILFDVIEHVENLSEFLSSLLCHVKPGGYVFINVPAMPSLYSAFDAAVGHYRRFTKEELELSLTRAGIQKLDCRYWGMTMIPFLLLRKLILSTSEKSLANDQNIVQLGVLPPGQLVHSLLKLIMQFETKLMEKPKIGTSLLYAGRVE